MHTYSLHPATNKLAPPPGAECAVELCGDKAGREASEAYLLIKELLNSQKLHGVQEWSMHSNTIRKHANPPLLIFIYAVSLIPT